jgi:hypothetical protein
MMLMAVGDPKFRIVDYPLDDASVSITPFKSIAEANRVLAEARHRRPDRGWRIIGYGPWGVLAVTTSGSES